MTFEEELIRALKNRVGEHPEERIEQARLIINSVIQALGDVPSEYQGSLELQRWRNTLGRAGNGSLSEIMGRIENS